MSVFCSTHCFLLEAVASGHRSLNSALPRAQPEGVMFRAACCLEKGNGGLSVFRGKWRAGELGGGI